MNQTYINLRFEQIEKRFNEIDILLDLALKSVTHNEIYQALCRSAHVLLISHFEGLYKEICRDIIDDLNGKTHFFEIKKDIFNTFCNYFTQTSEITKAVQNARQRLNELLKDHKSNLKVDPFLYVDNKNPAPEIIETILEKFGVSNFFWKIYGSDLDVVFEGQKSRNLRLLRRLHRYTFNGTKVFPYALDPSFYNPQPKVNQTKTKTLWEDFIDNLLKERHRIVHGHVTGNPFNHDELIDAKIKIEILLYAFMINICSAANPLFVI